MAGLHFDALAEIYLVDLWQMQLTEESKVSGGNIVLGERGGSALRSLHMNQLKKLANCYDNNSNYDNRKVTATMATVTTTSAK